MKPFFNIKFRWGPRESSEQVSLWVDLPRQESATAVCDPGTTAWRLLGGSKWVLVFTCYNDVKLMCRCMWDRVVVAAGCTASGG